MEGNQALARSTRSTRSAGNPALASVAPIDQPKFDAVASAPSRALMAWNSATVCSMICCALSTPWTSPADCPASAESPVHAGYKNAIVAAQATGTWVLNTRSSPCIRALKTDFTQVIHDAGLMPADTFKGIREVYFGGDMNAAPALAGQSAGLVHGVLSAQQIIEQTVAEFHAITARLGALATASNFG